MSGPTQSTWPSITSCAVQLGVDLAACTAESATRQRSSIGGRVTLGSPMAWATRPSVLYSISEAGSAGPA